MGRSKAKNGLYDVGNKTFRKQLSKKQKDLYMLADMFPVETKVMLTEIGEASKEEMQRIIRESVSPWGKFRMSEGLGGKGAGRYDTGLMHDSVTYVTEQAKDRVSVRVGWVRNFEDYFGYQEGGFKNWYTLGGFFNNRPWFRRMPAPVDQEGIFALRDSRMLAVQLMGEKVGQFIAKFKKIADGK
jgi:hypothetical protein